MQVANLAALGIGNKRYKCSVSDGAGSMEAVLGSEAAKLAASGALQEGGTLTMQDYVVNVINDAQKLVITGKLHLQACSWHHLQVPKSSAGLRFTVASQAGIWLKDCT